jgi:hypothetical protein
VGKSIGYPMREKLTLCKHAGVAIRSATHTRTHELWAGLWVKQTPSRNSARSLTALYNANIGNNPCPLPAAVNIGPRCAFRELHDKPGISSVTDRCSAHTLSIRMVAGYS